MTLLPTARAGRLAALLLTTLPAAASAATLGLVEVADTGAVPAPIHLAAPPGDDRLFVLSRNGQIRTIGPTGSVAQVFAGPGGGVAQSGERGAYAIAFAPDFDTSGHLYMSYVAPGDVHRVSRFTVPDRATGAVDPASERVIAAIPHPMDGTGNHYGGWIGFDTAGRLFVTTGDSGSLLQDNPPTLDPRLGKVLRIDPSTDAFPGDDLRNYAIPDDNAGGSEIYARDLRNPYRGGYDRETGTLLIADVGQNRVEEVNIGVDGASYGWPAFEGSLAFRRDLLPGEPSDFEFPAYEYLHDTAPIEGRSITGGEVYRGPIAALDGQYFFGDFGSGGIFSLDFVPDAMSVDAILPDESLTAWDIEIDGAPEPAIASLAGFGVDADGALYVLGLGFGGGQPAGVFRIASVEGFGAVPLPASAWLLLAGLGALAWRAQRRKAPTSSRCGDQRNWSTGRTQSSA